MRTYPTHIFCALVISLACCPALAQQKPPAGRSDMDPASRSKVANVLARSYLEEPSARTRAEHETVTTSSSDQGCTTNIGAPVTEGTQDIGSRYGAGNNDQVIVVRGSVINICK